VVSIPPSPLFNDQSHGTRRRDTKDAPKQITNGVGSIRLRFDNISSPLILAKGFNILDGQVEVTVPDLDPRTDYQVVLFGDSGNFSYVSHPALWL
jgi:hypothetical protein